MSPRKERPEMTERQVAEAYGLRPQRFKELDPAELTEIMEMRKALRAEQKRLERATAQAERFLHNRRKLIVQLRERGVMKSALGADIGKTDMVITQDEALMERMGERVSA